VRSAQCLDLVGQPAVLAGHVQLDVGEAAIDVAELGAHVANRGTGASPHLLPEFAILAVVILEFARLLVGQPGDDEIGCETYAAGSEDRQQDEGGTDLPLALSR
jgi:hypothetical protein